MKKHYISFIFFGIILSSCASNTKKVDILKTTNIKEIEEYLSKTYPEDPKKRILQQKVIALKNSEWTKGAKNAKPMQARPIFMELPTLSNNKKASDLANQELFKKLMSETSDEHKQKTTQLLNNMFNEDITHNEAIILLKNNSDCNLVLEITGNKFYNIAVPAKGQNFIIVAKDNYSFSGNLCDVKYKSLKEIKKGTILVLNNPEVLSSLETNNLVPQNNSELEDKKDPQRPKKTNSSIKRKKKK